MADPIKLACETKGMLIKLQDILPSRLVPQAVKKTAKYRRIVASVRKLGLVEPLIVFPQSGASGKFMLLDGHLRREALLELGKLEAPCLLSTDDEAYTYNHKINRVSAIQEHMMIAQAVKNGVSREEIAEALEVDVASVLRKLDMLNGICREVVDVLKEKKVTGAALREIRKAKPMRQIEIAELMIASNNYTVLYAKCLITATPSEQLIEPEKSKETKGLTPEEIARMETEMETVGRDFKLIEESHGKNMLNLVIVVGYLRKLLDNARVVRFLSQNRPELLTELNNLIQTKGLQPEKRESA
jgi:hypothetical protein